MINLRLASLVLGSAVFAFTGCDVGGVVGPGPGGGGGGGGGGGVDAGQAAEADAAPQQPDAMPPDYALSVPQTPVELTLGQTTELVVTLTSARFTGPVTLSADGVPGSWLVSFEPSNVANLTYDGTADVTVRIEVPTDGEAANATLNITAEAAPGMRSSTAPINVANEVTVVIPAGTGAGAHVFPQGLPVRVGTTIKILNADGTNHRIHSGSGDAGFPHEEGELSEGQAYTFSFTATGGYGYYCHLHDAAAGTGSFAVSAP